MTFKDIIKYIQKRNTDGFFSFSAAKRIDVFNPDEEDKKDAFIFFFGDSVSVWPAFKLDDENKLITTDNIEQTYTKITPAIIDEWLDRSRSTYLTALKNKKEQIVNMKMYELSKDFI